MMLGGKKRRADVGDFPDERVWRPKRRTALILHHGRRVKAAKQGSDTPSCPYPLELKVRTRVLRY